MLSHVTMPFGPFPQSFRLLDCSPASSFICLGNSHVKWYQSLWNRKFCLCRIYMLIYNPYRVSAVRNASRFDATPTTLFPAAPSFLTSELGRPVRPSEPALPMRAFLDFCDRTVRQYQSIQTTLTVSKLIGWILGDIPVWLPLHTCRERCPPW